MSYFITNNFQTKGSQIRLKGGDNNIVPRMNEWTGYFSGFIFCVDFSGGSIQLPFNTQSNKLLILEEAYTNTCEYFRTNHNIESFYQFNKVKNENQELVDLISKKFIEFIEIAKNKAKEKYILKAGNEYLFDIRRGKAFATKNIETADKLGYFKATKLEKAYSSIGAEMVKV